MSSAQPDTPAQSSTTKAQDLQEYIKTVRSQILSLTTKLGELENERTEHSFADLHIIRLIIHFAIFFTSVCCTL